MWTLYQRSSHLLKSWWFKLLFKWPQIHSLRNQGKTSSFVINSCFKKHAHNLRILTKYSNITLQIFRKPFKILPPRMILIPGLDFQNFFSFLMDVSLRKKYPNAIIKINCFADSLKIEKNRLIALHTNTRLFPQNENYRVHINHARAQYYSK